MKNQNDVLEKINFFNVGLNGIFFWFIANSFSTKGIHFNKMGWLVFVEMAASIVTYLYGTKIIKALNTKYTIKLASLLQITNVAFITYAYFHSTATIYLILCLISRSIFSLLNQLIYMAVENHSVLSNTTDDHRASIGKIQRGEDRGQLFGPLVAMALFWFKQSEAAILFLVVMPVATFLYSVLLEKIGPMDKVEDNLFSKNTLGLIRNNSDILKIFISRSFLFWIAGGVYNSLSYNMIAEVYPAQYALFGSLFEVLDAVGRNIFHQTGQKIARKFSANRVAIYGIIGLFVFKLVFITGIQYLYLFMAGLLFKGLFNALFIVGGRSVRRITEYNVSQGRNLSAIIALEGLIAKLTSSFVAFVAITLNESWGVSIFMIMLVASCFNLLQAVVQSSIQCQE